MTNPRPSFQFYPGDWRKNANLRRCSPAARGVWLDVMCVLHDQEEYGLARWTLSDIAKAATASMVHLRELVQKNVLKGVDKGLCAAFIYVPRSGRKDGEPVILVPEQAGPIWYSSRMVRDEYVRTIRAEAGATGASPKASPKPPKGEAKEGGIGPRGSSSSSSPSGGNTSDPYGSGGGPPAPPALPPTAPVPPKQDSLYDDLPPAPDPAPVKPVDVIFGLGLPLLIKAGVPEKDARSFLGLQRKGGDDKLVEAIRSAVETQALQPLEFIAGCMNVKPTKASSHTGFAAKDYHAGANADGSF